MDMTLESLLQGLEKQAAEVEASQQVTEVAQVEKKASVEASGTDLAQQIMQKVASVQLLNKDSEMNKQAAEAGKLLADALLTKLANAGDITTVEGIPAGVVPNKAQVDNAQLVAEQDAAVKAMPTGDGVRNYGTINQIFDGIVADALGAGASVPTLAQGDVAMHEGAVAQHAVPNQVPNEGVEKTAAVMSLVNSGFDFDSAVDMVKQAALAIQAEEQEQVKMATMNELLNQGVDFDLAVALVKQAGMPTMAGMKEAVTGLGAKMQGYGTQAGAKLQGLGAKVQGYGTQAGAQLQGLGAKAQGYGNQAKDWANANASNASDAFGRLRAGTTPEHKNLLPGQMLRDAVSPLQARLQAAKELATNPLVYGGVGAAGLAAGGAGAYALTREKQAAVDSLCQNGVDFDTAVGLVQAKSQELYGA